MEYDSTFNMGFQIFPPPSTYNCWLISCYSLPRRKAELESKSHRLLSPSTIKTPTGRVDFTCIQCRWLPNYDLSLKSSIIAWGDGKTSLGEESVVTLPKGRVVETRLAPSCSYDDQIRELRRLIGNCEDRHWQPVVTVSRSTRSTEVVREQQHVHRQVLWFDEKNPTRYITTYPDPKAL